nr:MAG TPA: hypothetical protein [Caudoviricetes sp.]
MLNALQGGIGLATLCEHIVLMVSVPLSVRRSMRLTS